MIFNRNIIRVKKQIFVILLILSFFRLILRDIINNFDCNTYYVKGFGGILITVPNMGHKTNTI